MLAGLSGLCPKCASTPIDIWAELQKITELVPPDDMPEWQEALDEFKRNTEDE
jgi:hypothetical protein